MMIPIEDVLTKTCDIKQFSELEGWDVNVSEALLHYIFGLRRVDSDKTTTRVLCAWDALEAKDKVILEEHLGRKNIVILGISIIRFEEVKQATIKQLFGGIIEKIIRIEEDKDDKD